MFNRRDHIFYHSRRLCPATTRLFPSVVELAHGSRMQLEQNSSMISATYPWYSRPFVSWPSFSIWDPSSLQIADLMLAQRRTKVLALCLLRPPSDLCSGSRIVAHLTVMISLLRRPARRMPILDPSSTRFSCCARCSLGTPLSQGVLKVLCLAQPMFRQLQIRHPEL